MHLVTCDYESFWSKDHSLSKMSYIEYCMHPETEIISLSAKVNDEETIVVFGEEEARRLLIDCRIEDALLVSHNASGFDSMLTAWRLKLAPRMWGCTLAMARPHHERTIGLSLKTLVRHYGLGEKNDAILVQTKGKHLADFTPEEIAAMRIYNRDDTDQCRALFSKLRPLTSNSEMWVIDSNIRMLVEDEFVLNEPLLQAALQREQASKRKTLLRLAEHLGIDAHNDGIDSSDEVAQMVKDELMSGPKFAALLRTLDVEPPLKPSPSDPDKWIPALAKDDPEFQELVEHDNEVVAAAAAARLEMKSTLLETRIQAFLATAAVREGKLPIPAKYYGAHTGRDSGELYNALNLPRIGQNKDGSIVPKRTNALRLSLTAPEGKVVGVADLSGIEMRVNHTLWKVGRTMRLWQADPRADIYKDTASRYYGVPEDQVQPAQRQFGKVLELACGFGVGPPKFRAFSRKFDLFLTDTQAESGVYGWRDITPEIADSRTGGWARCQSALDYIEAGELYYIDPWRLTHTSREGVHLPDGRVIRYPDLRKEVNNRTGRVEWKYGRGRHTRYIYGGKMDENIVQALARIILMDNVKEFWKRTGLRPKLRVYDEAVYLFLEAQARGLLDELLSIMRTPPPWWPQLVTWSEGDMSYSYGLAK